MILSAPTVLNIPKPQSVSKRTITLKQVFENTESTKRQYALRERAIALGWPVVQIVTVDSDLGETATSVADRQGFQKLMAEVSLGRVGLVRLIKVWNSGSSPRF
jgi:DNA invertase Pin-like site-specific DNA recombinase